MSEFRDLQAKLEKIEEGYYKDLDIDLQELRRANKTLSPVELVSLARQRFGQDAATHLSNQLEREGDAKDYRKQNQTYFKEEGAGVEENISPSSLDGDLFVDDELHAHIEAKLQQDSPRSVVWAYNPGEVENLITVGIRDYHGHTHIKTFDKDTGEFIIPNDKDFDAWMDQNPFESIEEGFGEETYDEMVEYWKTSLSQSIVQKGVFTQLYDAANRNIEELNAAIEEQAHSIAETYHGSGEGIGTSDQNHFVASIARQLGIDDVFGWNKPRKGIEEESFTDRVKRYKGETDDILSDNERRRQERKYAMTGSSRGRRSYGRGTGSALGTLGMTEDHHSEDPISVQIKSLLAQGKKVVSKIGGAVGEIVGTEGRLIYIKIRGMATPAVTSFDSKNNVEIVGNIDHYDVIEHFNYPNEVDEGKWDYNKRDKGKGAGITSPMYDGGADNRKNRKAFRKAEKAKAHAARMRGEVDEEFELDEARGRVVEVPPELRGSDAGNAAGATSRDAERFLADLGPDDDVSHDVVDPETGELLDWPTKGPNRNEREDDEDAAYWRAQGGTKRERGMAKFKVGQGSDFDAVPILHLSMKGPGFGEGQDIAGQFLNELRDSDFYNVVWRDIADDVEDPGMMRDNDYDIDVEIPVLLKRKDGKKLTDDDHDNIKEIMKAVKLASTLGNIGIGYAGTTDEGTTARFHSMFH